MVWEFFNLTADNKFVVCSLCKKQYKFFKNTTNLKEHLKRMHPSNLLVPSESNDDEESSPIASTSSEQFPPSNYDEPSISTSTTKQTTSAFTSKPLVSHASMLAPIFTVVRKVQTSTASTEQSSSVSSPIPSTSGTVSLLYTLLNIQKIII